MYYNLTEEEIRSKCKAAIENLEKWARLIIDKELTSKYGQDYFYAKDSTNNYIVKKEIREKAENLKKQYPDRFKRMVDTLFLDEIIYFLCKESLYKECFKKFLDITYPEGRMEANHYLSAIIPIRNNLSHSNPISIREAEKSICYSNDFVEGVKEYMKQNGQQTKYNVPNVIKINDSLGNEFFLKNDEYYESFKLNDKNGSLFEFEIGDIYTVWLTLDSSFDISEYNFTCSYRGKIDVISNTSAKISLEMTEELVGEQIVLTCTLKSSKNWHKYNIYDQQFAIVFSVLPPK